MKKPSAQSRTEARVYCFEVWMLTSLPGSKSGISLLSLKEPDMARMKRTNSEPRGPVAAETGGICFCLTSVTGCLCWALICAAPWKQVDPVTSSQRAFVLGPELTLYLPALLANS